MKPAIPNTPREVSESSVTAKSLLKMRFDEALSVRYFCVCGRLKVDRNN